MSETAVKEICGGYITADTPDGEKQIPADNVVIAAGFSPETNDITLACLDERISCAKIGDCAKVGDAMKGIHEAYDLFLRLFIA